MKKQIHSTHKLTRAKKIKNSIPRKNMSQTPKPIIDYPGNQNTG